MKVNRVLVGTLALVLAAGFVTPAFAGLLDPRFLEVDFFPDSIAHVIMQDPDGNIVRVDLSGPSTVEVEIDPDTFEVPFPNTGPDIVDTELVQLDLVGSSPFGPVFLEIRDDAKSPFQRSFGQIQEAIDTLNGFLDLPPVRAGPPASSFFDVFFEINVGGFILHNEDPLFLEAVQGIKSKPPALEDEYCEFGPVLLFDENNQPTGFLILEACHTPNPRNGNGPVGVEVGVDAEYITPDTTELLLVVVQTNLAWIVPVALSAVGIGVILVRKKF